MDTERLKSVPLFAELDKGERERVARWADEIEVETGKHLADQGEFAHEFFVIQEGTADVLIDGKKVNALQPGEWFGEIALEETDRRTASVVATSPMRLIVMFARDFREMEAEMPHVAKQIHTTMRERLAGG
jgi:cAMP-dependent protein kinase regulator